MLEYLYEALASAKGIKLSVSDMEAAKRRLYKARADACDPDLEQLALVPSPTSSTELWILRRKPDGITQGNREPSKDHDQRVLGGLEVAAGDLRENGREQSVEADPPQAQAIDDKENR